jgi:hypothetical protein
MLSTVNFITSIIDVPREWIFEYYLNLSCKLCGQTVKIKSAFNPGEKTESMYIYYDDNKGYYRFKDFSSGFGGDCSNLVMELYNLSRKQANLKIVLDYSKYIEDNKYDAVTEYKVAAAYRVNDYTIRNWNILDQSYWTEFKIGTKQLNKYEIIPLEYYVLSKREEDIETSFTIKGEHIYGYFKEDGTLYKIYQPKNKEKKFIKVLNYIQGSEQLTYQTKYLLIISSLKDLMAFNALGIQNIEGVVPDSENSLLPDSLIQHNKEKYSKIITLLDNDTAGIAAMQRYKEKHDINYVIPPAEKDIADCVKVHGIEKTRDMLLPLLKQAL